MSKVAVTTNLIFFVFLLYVFGPMYFFGYFWPVIALAILVTIAFMFMLWVTIYQIIRDETWK